jgi:hypothetical protein
MPSAIRSITDISQQTTTFLTTHSYSSQMAFSFLTSHSSFFQSSQLTIAFFSQLQLNQTHPKLFANYLKGV